MATKISTQPSASPSLAWAKTSAEVIAAAPGTIAIRKSLLAEAEPIADTRRIKFVISTGDVDRDNDTINADGWDLSNYRKNPVVLFAHSHTDLPIGKCVELGFENGKLVATAEFATAEENPLADQVYRLLLGGYLNATSVGFRAIAAKENVERGGVDFTRQELLEFSVVPVPANQHALIAASFGGDDLEPLRKWIGATIEAWPGDLKLDGKAWTKLVGADGGIRRRLKVGMLESEVRVDSTKALESIGALESSLDRVIAKTARASGTVAGLAPVYASPDETDDGRPVRWNKSLSKAFDVNQQEFPAQSLEQELASKYIGVKISGMNHGVIRVRSPRMGAFLTALDEFVEADAVAVAAIRNIDDYGKEAPPQYEKIQLNSTESHDFLIEGMRFFEWNGEKLCIRVEPRWYGLQVSHYSIRAGQTCAGNAALDAVQTRAKQLNFLKGEAFALSGEFLTRGAETVDDLILEDKNQAVVRRTMALVEERGAAMEPRGQLLIGPPGTGKTLAGRIMMNGTKATFIWISSRDMAYLGPFDAIVEAFDSARENANSILFFEDVDNWINSGTITDLLKTELDGIKQNTGILTILTTNYPERLPKALIDRPGRFHDVLRFDLPNEKQRAAMLAKWLPDLSQDDVAAAVVSTAGMSGAHVRELTRFATLIASQDGLDKTAALAKALEKLQEQRDLITAVQAQGSTYRAPSAIAEKAGDGARIAAFVAKTFGDGADLAERVMAFDRLDAASAKALIDGSDEPTLDVSDDADEAIEIIDAEPVLELDVEDEMELEVEGIGKIGDAEFRALLADVVGSGMTALSQHAVERAMNQMRGRVD